MPKKQEKTTRATTDVLTEPAVEASSLDAVAIDAPKVSVDFTDLAAAAQHAGRVFGLQEAQNIALLYGGYPGKEIAERIQMVILKARR